MILILFVDWVSFLLLLVMGVASGVALYAYKKTGGGPFIPQELYSLLIYTYLGPIIYIILFSRKKEIVQLEKLTTMKMLAGSIAHELRTPLSSLSMDSKFLAKLFPYYQDAYEQAKNAQLPVHSISHNEEVGMREIPKNMQAVSKNAHTIVSMLLTNLNEETTNLNNEECSMKVCVTEALKCYPFSPYERKLLHWDENGHDFSFLGHKEFMKHVLFNLIKNALYAIASAGKGEIYITIEPQMKSKDQNKLIFKDTGPGIAPQDLRHIFDRFYSRKEHGTGIGLAFCQSVIQGFGGEISCKSREGEYTTFTIAFPILANRMLRSGKDI